MTSTAWKNHLQNFRKYCIYIVKAEMVKLY